MLPWTSASLFDVVIAQNSGDNVPAGLVIAFVSAFGVLMGLLGWLIKHLFTATIPQQVEAFSKATAQQTTAFNTALTDVLKHCKEEAEAERAASERRYSDGMGELRAAHASLVAKLDQLHQDSRDTVHALRNLDHGLRLRTRMADVLPSLEAPAWTKDLNGILLSWNTACERMLGWRQGEVVGRSIYDVIIPPERRQEEEGILRRIGAGESVPEYRTERMRSDGSRARLLLVTSPIRDASGKVVGASTIAREL